MVSERFSWPALSYEQLPWTSRGDVPMSRQAQRRARGEYLAAVVPPIATTAVSLPPEILAEAEDAATEVARFDAEAGGEISPFAAVLLRSESAASSRIENLTASARAIAEAELGFGSRKANMIVANQQAMTAAVALANRIDSGAILQMHQALLASAQPDIAGKWREEQVWIGGTTVSPHGALFVPPHHRHIRAAIDDLLAFVSRTDIPTLTHAALAHAQFETIHPFADGNGRTGRALIHAQLRNARLTRHVTVPVSSGLLANVEAYFEALTDYRNGNPGPIVQRFSEAAFIATANGRRLVADLRTIRSTWETRIRARRDSAAWRVADLLLRQPVVNARFAANELNVAPNNVYRLFEPLLRAEVIVEFSNKRRDQLWRAPEVLAVLDAFAQRASRRRRPTT